MDSFESKAKEDAWARLGEQERKAVLRQHFEQMMSEREADPCLVCGSPLRSDGYCERVWLMLEKTNDG